MEPLLLVNFGGPRDLEEVPIFLKELLCDKDVIRTKFPQFFHNLLFRRVAQKRSLKVKEDYAKIGGKSPIYFDTENIKHQLQQTLHTEVITFHRYLPSTHAATIEAMKKIDRIKVLPLFPQFCYATTGSVARFLAPHSRGRLRWVKSYADHPAFILSYQTKIQNFLKEKNLQEEDSLLLFSAHGVPKAFIQGGDPYEKECRASFDGIMKGFSKAEGLLSYQSKFGRGEWLKPYTDEVCQEILHYSKGKKQVVFVPLSFTSDHIETLFEVEELYLPVVREKGLAAYRCPALNLEPFWIEALSLIAKNSPLFENQDLIL